MISLQEEHMAKCLDIAYKTNIPKQQRKAKVAKSPDWQIMEKKWRSILTLALDETEVPGDDEESNAPRSNRMMRRRGRGGSAKSAIDWLPENEAISSDTQASKSFILVVIKILLSIKTCLSSFHFWKADEIRKVKKRDGSSSVLVSI